MWSCRAANAVVDRKVMDTVCLNECDEEISKRIFRIWVWGGGDAFHAFVLFASKGVISVIVMIVGDIIIRLLGVNHSIS